MNSDKQIMPTVAIFADIFEPISNHHLQMVGSHIHWIDKFRDSIVNKETPLDIETISRDDCCTFGKWLHDGHTRLRLGHLHRYHVCVAKHATFHIEAGKVAELANKGKYADALQALNSDSDFSRASIYLVATIFPLVPNPFLSDDYWKTKLHLSIQTKGLLPAIGSQIPDFYLANSNLDDVNLASYSGNRKILNILPSLGVPGCADLIQKFNQNIVHLENIVVMVITADLPSVQRCFFQVDVLHNAIMLSTFRNPTFAANYGVQISSGRLAGLMAPAVVVVDSRNKVIYTEFLSELAQEPNYELIFEALKRADDADISKYEHLNIPNVDESGENLREHFRVNIPIAHPCYCEIVLLPASKDNTTTEYKNAYALAVNKIQTKKYSFPCMRLSLRDISVSGCSIVNCDEVFSYFLQPHTIYKDCTICIPNDGEVTVTFKIMSKHKLEPSDMNGFSELIGIRFIGMLQPVEFVISHYVQELERQRISLLRDYLPKQE